MQHYQTESEKGPTLDEELASKKMSSTKNNQTKQWPTQSLPAAKDFVFIWCLSFSKLSDMIPSSLPASSTTMTTTFVHHRSTNILHVPSLCGSTKNSIYKITYISVSCP
ncbi:hypothetical protein ACH5RR_017403 [Cinchona calisaya]|uniref:Uncharacterized protein n=1 Tax=Cinchona calisaya TaxID=153742 RepID=A0ABD2ZIG6_9GENT